MAPLNIRRPDADRIRLVPVIGLLVLLGRWLKVGGLHGRSSPRLEAHLEDAWIVTLATLLGALLLLFLAWILSQPRGTADTGDAPPVSAAPEGPPSPDAARERLSDRPISGRAAFVPGAGPDGRTTGMPPRRRDLRVPRTPHRAVDRHADHRAVMGSRPGIAMAPGVLLFPVPAPRPLGRRTLASRPR